MQFFLLVYPCLERREVIQTKTASLRAREQTCFISDSGGEGDLLDLLSSVDNRIFILKNIWIVGFPTFLAFTLWVMKVLSGYMCSPGR